MYDIDLFDTPVATIKDLQSAGSVVICYFSAGSFEPWRPDADTFSERVKGKKMDGWDELWLDISNLEELGPYHDCQARASRRKRLRRRRAG